MKTQIPTRWALAVASVLSLTATLFAGDHDGVFEQTLTVSGPAEVEVATNSGNIDVRPGDGARVHIRGLIKVNRWLSAEEADRIIKDLVSHSPVEQSGSHIRIGQIKDWKLGGLISIIFDRHPFSISYELVVPADTRLKSDTGSGDQTVAGLKGTVRATTGSGNIRLSDLAGDSRASTGSGDIEINGVSETVYAETGSGNIRAVGVSGSIRANTGSGDVSVDGSAKGPVDVTTGSGNLEVRGVAGPLRAGTGSGNIAVSGQPGGDWKIETGSGGVTLKLSAQASFNLHAHTGSGSIESSLPITIQGKVNRSELRGAVRGGGSLVNVGTGSGDIRIE